MNYRTVSIIYLLLTLVSAPKIILSQIIIESLGLQNKKITSIGYNYSILAVGTDKNGVYWQIGHPTDSTWNTIGLEAYNVQTVYPHKSGPLGWAIGSGIHNESIDTNYVFCSFMGGDPVPINAGFLDSLTNGVTQLDGFPDPTICGETYAAGGKVLYRRTFNDTIWHPVHITSWEGNIYTVKTRLDYPGIVMAGGSEGFTGFLLIMSNDFGEHWTDISPPGTVFDIDFGGDSAAIIFAATYTDIYRSTDKGNHWESVLHGQGQNHYTRIIFDSHTNCVYAAGSNAQNGTPILYFSNNNGEIWEKIELGIQGEISDMIFGPSDLIYFATIDGGLYRFSQGTVSIEDNIVSSISGFGLLQNYPNPFNAMTTIHYSIAKAGKVCLTIHNLLGQQITCLFNQYHLPGEYSIQWKPSRIASGIYFCSLRMKEYSKLCKITIQE